MIRNQDHLPFWRREIVVHGRGRRTRSGASTGHSLAIDRQEKRSRAKLRDQETKRPHHTKHTKHNKHPKPDEGEGCWGAPRRWIPSTEHYYS